MTRIEIGGVAIDDMRGKGCKKFKILRQATRERGAPITEEGEKITAAELLQRMSETEDYGKRTCSKGGTTFSQDYCDRPQEYQAK